jgi:DNA-binding protein YbaB
MDDLERIARESEETMKRLAEAQREVDEVRGEGSGADGMISVVTDGGGRVREITLNPRVMRLESQTLAEELTAAVQAAQQDGERKTRELLSEAMGGLEIPTGMADLDKFEEQLMRSHEAFARTMDESMNNLDRRRFGRE